MNSEALRDLVVEALEDIKGLEIVTMDVRSQTDIADYMVVASGGTGRQVKALINSVLVKAKAQGANVVGMEGLDAGEWVLLDLTDVIVHVMLPVGPCVKRCFYHELCLELLRGGETDIIL